MPSSLGTQPLMLLSGTTPSFKIQRTKRERPGLASGESGQDRTCECRLAAKGEMLDVTKERSRGMRSVGSGPERAKEEKPSETMTAEMTAGLTVSRCRIKLCGRALTRVVRGVDVDVLVEREVTTRVQRRVGRRVELGERLLQRPREPLLHPTFADGSLRGLTKSYACETGQRILLRCVPMGQSPTHRRRRRTRCRGRTQSRATHPLHVQALSSRSDEVVAEITDP